MAKASFPRPSISCYHNMIALLINSGGGPGLVDNNDTNAIMMAAGAGNAKFFTWCHGHAEWLRTDHRFNWDQRNKSDGRNCVKLVSYDGCRCRQLDDEGDDPGDNALSPPPFVYPSLSTPLCPPLVVDPSVSTRLCPPISVYVRTYPLCLRISVYPSLSTPLCPSLSVHPSLSTPLCLPIAVYPSLATPLCLPLPVYPSLSTPLCPPLAVYPSLSTYVRTPLCLPISFYPSLP